MADVTPLYTESNLKGTLNSAISASDTTIVATFIDRVTGAARTPDTKTKLYVIDKGSASIPLPNYELILAGTVSTTAGVTTLTNCVRGLAFSGTSVSSGTGNSHQAAAEIGCVDNHLLTNLVVSILDGTNSPPADLTMGTHKITNLGTPTANADAATKAYADGLAIAGAPDSSTTVKGISKMSAAPASATNPIAVGDNDPRLTYSGATASATNKAVTMTGLQNSEGIYYADSVGTDSYAITPSPAIAAYAAGQHWYVKVGAANSGACSLNVNAKGARAIKKYIIGLISDTETGDIVNGQVIHLVDDGTQFILMNPSATTITTANEINLTNGTDASALHTHSHVTSVVIKSGMGNSNGNNNDITITHGLGVTPKMVELFCIGTLSNTNNPPMISQGSYDGSTYACIYTLKEGNPGYTTTDSNAGIAKISYNGTGSTVAGTTVTVTTLNSTTIVLHEVLNTNAAPYYYFWKAYT